MKIRYIAYLLLIGTLASATPEEAARTLQIFTEGRTGLEALEIRKLTSHLLVADWNKLCADIKNMVVNVIPGQQKTFRDTLLENIRGAATAFSPERRAETAFISGRLYENIKGAVDLSVEEYLTPEFRVKQLDLCGELGTRNNLERKINYVKNLKEEFRTQHAQIERKLEEALPRLTLTEQERNSMREALLPRREQEMRPLEARHRDAKKNYFELLGQTTEIYRAEIKANEKEQTILNVLLENHESTVKAWQIVTESHEQTLKMLSENSREQEVIALHKMFLVESDAKMRRLELLESLLAVSKEKIERSQEALNLQLTLLGDVKKDMPRVDFLEDRPRKRINELPSEGEPFNQDRARGIEGRESQNRPPMEDEQRRLEELRKMCNVPAELKEFIDKKYAIEDKRPLSTAMLNTMLPVITQRFGGTRYDFAKFFEGIMANKDARRLNVDSINILSQNNAMGAFCAAYIKVANIAGVPKEDLVLSAEAIRAIGACFAPCDDAIGTRGKFFEAVSQYNAPRFTPDLVDLMGDFRLNSVVNNYKYTPDNSFSTEVVEALRNRPGVKNTRNLLPSERM